MKRILSILLCAALVFGACGTLVACGGTEPTPPTPPTPPAPPADPIDYTVKLTDYYGAPLVTVAVAKLVGENGSILQEKRVAQDGTAVFSAIPGNYKVNVEFFGTEAPYMYDENKAAFTAEKTTLEIKAYSAPKDEKETICVPCIQHTTAEATDKYCAFCGNDISVDLEGSGDYNACGVGEGATLVELDRKEMSYFIFTPTRGGIYKFSFIVDGEATYGYFGSPHFVFPYNIAEITDGSFEETVSNSSIGDSESGTLQMVLGISAKTAKNAVVIIERIGSTEPEIPYTEIEADPSLEGYTAEAGTYVDIDITSADVKVFYNEADGYYHYGSPMGPVVLMKIAVVSGSGIKNSSIPSFLFASYQEICSTDSMCKFFYDEDGNLIRKERYNDLIAAYAAKAGTVSVSYSAETVDYKVMPLDAALAAAIQNTAEHRMWFDKDTGIFGEYANSVNMENAWLYACCYKEI